MNTPNEEHQEHYSPDREYIEYQMEHPEMHEQPPKPKECVHESEIISLLKEILEELKNNNKTINQNEDWHICQYCGGRFLKNTVHACITM